VVGAVVAALVAALGWWLVAVGALVGAVVATSVLARGVAGITASIGAVRLADAARLENLVDGLCVTNGIAHPQLYVVEHPGRNACAVGISPNHAHLVVTRGALDDLGRIELEAIVARELALIKSGYAALASVVAVIARFWPAMASRLLPERVDVIADLEGVSFTRYPPGLLEALDKVRQEPSVPSAPRWTRHLWIDDPVEPAPGRTGPFHSPIDERIATLREL
jgi:heat shock protein HtpX